jgi:CARDB
VRLRATLAAAASAVALACAAAVALAGAVPAPASAAVAEGPVKALPATVRVLSCSRDEQSAVFYARMRSVPGSVRLALRFRLLGRAGGADFSPVAAPGLGRWRRSKPGVAAFGFRQAVRGLSPGASYRMEVDYRWYGRGGRVVRRAGRRSAVCRQVAPLPNLRAELLSAQPYERRPDVLSYLVRVANGGAAPALAVPVRLLVDGASVDTRLIARLARGESVTLAFPGPPCLDVTGVDVDPDNVVPELLETDNVDVVACAALRG